MQCAVTYSKKVLKRSKSIAKYYIFIELLYATDLLETTRARLLYPETTATANQSVVAVFRIRKPITMSQNQFIFVSDVSIAWLFLHWPYWIWFMNFISLMLHFFSNNTWRIRCGFFVCKCVSKIDLRCHEQWWEEKWLNRTESGTNRSTTKDVYTVEECLWLNFLCSLDKRQL